MVVAQPVEGDCSIQTDHVRIVTVDIQVQAEAVAVAVAVIDSALLWQGLPSALLVWPLLRRKRDVGRNVAPRESVDVRSNSMISSFCS